MKNNLMEDKNKENQSFKLKVWVIGMLIVTSSMGIMVFSASNASAVPLPIELRCGTNFAGMGNVVFGGLDLPLGCLVEIFNNATGLATGKTFHIGDGTEGPPGVFKAGQFDYSATFQSTELPMTIFLRAYNANSVANATTYGDSVVRTITVQATYDFPGWSLLALDTEAPISQIDNIALYWHSPVPLVITATASDNASGVAHVEFWYRYRYAPLAWVNWSKFNGNDTTFPYSITFNWPNSDAEYEIYSIAVDNAGNRELPPVLPSSDEQFGLDSTPPSSYINQINPYWRNMPLTLTPTYNYTVASVRWIDFYYRYSNNNATWGAWTNAGQSSTFPYQYTFTFPSGNGYYQFYSRAYDYATNYEPAPAGADTIAAYDNVLPTSSVNAIIPYFYTTTPISISVTSADATPASGNVFVSLWYRYSSPTNATFGAWTLFQNDTTVPFGPFSFNWPSGQGYYEFYTRTGDRARNYEAAPANPGDDNAKYDASAPTIISIVPADGAVGVALNSAVVVTWSEAMSPLVGNVNITPAPIIPGTWAWSVGNTVLTYSGATWRENQLNTLTFNLFTDAAGNAATGDLVKVFTTLGNPPTITNTAPINAATGIALTANVVVTFSEAMNPATVTYTCVPAVTVWSVVWSGGNTIATYSHTLPYVENTLYTFQITGGQDANGVSLAAGLVPNPWTFRTLGIAPTILSTNPVNGATNVALNSNVVVTFNESMNIGTVTYTCVPAVTAWSVVWSVGNTIATYSHTNPYAENTLYTFTITAGNDANGVALVAGAVPNPWTFICLGIAPTVTNTIPANGATGVALGANVVVTFSEAMNTGSVGFTCSPNPGVWAYAWSAGNTILTCSHAMPFTENTLYTCSVTGTDAAGNALIPGAVPNPWSFRTIGVAPTIISTSPANGAIGVALTANVVVTFSEPMSIGTVTYTCAPNPGGWLPGVWSSGNTILTLSHSIPFAENTLYTFTITGGTDAFGVLLVPGGAPNPWSFTTVGVAPTIVSTNPANGATGVALTANVVVTFSEAMNTPTVTYTCTPNPGGWLPGVWSGGNTILTLSHTNPFSENLVYTFRITAGFDMSAIALAAGAVPNPWTFTTIGIAPTITVTSPVNAATGVALTSTVVVTFSEAMNTATVTYTCVPAVTVWSVVWSAGNTTATYSHTNSFTESTLYTFRITAGNDVNGVALAAGAVPNPWVFTTIGVAPTITVTNPVNTATGVLTTSTVVVTFSEAMNNASVTYTCVPAITVWSVVWSAGNTIATYSHTNPFVINTLYTFTITAGTDVAGNALVAGAVPNPWTFTTLAPAIATATGPISVTPTNVAAITITYTYAGTPTSVNLYYTTNGGTAWTLAGNDASVDGSYVFTLTLSGTYGWLASAVGGGSIELSPPTGGTAPEATPYLFDNVRPTITVTSPVNGATSVPITSTVVVTFSEAMNPATVAFTCIPDPTGWSVAWNVGNTVVTYSHVNNFVYGTLHTFTIIAGSDAAGNMLNAGAVPNPWTFTTADPAATIATGPISAVATNAAVFLITYTYTGAPTSINLYYTTNGGTTWTLAGNDVTVDGSYLYTLTVSGTYGWIASAVGGGSIELSPPTGGTAPEATPYIFDNIAPTSFAGPLPLYSNTLNFSVPYTANDNIGGSGMAFVELYWKLNSAPTWSNYGAFSSSPISFTALNGGDYRFFTIAVDNAGNRESMKSIAEATIRVDTGAPIAAQNLKVYVHTDGTSTLSWGPSTSMDLDHYNIYISSDPYNFNFAIPSATTTGISWLHVIGGDISTNFYYIVRAVDLAGNEDANTNAVGKFVLSLNVGWNLVSVPLLSWDTTLDSVFGANLTGSSTQTNSDKVFSWDGISWRVAYMYEVGDPVFDGTWMFMGGTFNIQPDRGYWVYINEAPAGPFPQPLVSNPPACINITGNMLGIRSVPLSVGWNLVGYTSLMPATLQNGAIDSASGLWASGFTGGTNQATSDRIISWNGGGFVPQYMWEAGGASDGTWIGTTFNLAPGRGYWIEIRATHTAFTWTYGN